MDRQIYKNRKIFLHAQELEYDLIKIGKRIRGYREDMEMTRYDLAAAVGISTDTLRRIEQGERDARGEVLCRISSELCVPVECLLRGEHACGFICEELEEVFKRTNYRQQQAVAELVKVFRVGE